MNKILSLGGLAVCGAIASVVVYENLKPQPSCACASEAKTYIGSMNRAQQALYLDQKIFAHHFDTLKEAVGLEITNQTEHYRYTFEKGDEAVFHYAQPLENHSGKFGYVGGVFLKNENTDPTLHAIICVAEQPGWQTLEHPIDEDTCAPGTRSVD